MTIKAILTDIEGTTSSIDFVGVRVIQRRL
jgi:methionine salvage enolase-phosphatase E1